MSLYQGSAFWEGEQYQQLTDLHLPGPALVIDVRCGNDYDPPLIWNLAIELEDLSSKMKLNRVLRWRSLTDFIDLLKLSPIDANVPVVEKSDFLLTTRAGKVTSFYGATELINGLGREHIDRVRNNRVGASRDKSTDSMNQRVSLGDPEQSTVRVFFLTDAEDTSSLVSAATYARWLKQWYHEYEDTGRSGRDKRISTTVICMNADPYRHSLEYLAKYLHQVSDPQPVLDTVILLQTYGNDETYIGGEIQSYQVELILYTLLLRSLENLMESAHEMIDVQSLSPYIYSDSLEEKQHIIPWAVYMVGISSLEYSARWGSRWLDYGLVTKIIHLMRESSDVDREYERGHLQKIVQEAMKSWLQEVRDTLSMFTTIIPELQVLDDLRMHLASPPLAKKRGASLIQALKTYSEFILQSYKGPGKTLENCIQCAHLIPWQIKTDSMQISSNILTESSLENDPYQKLLILQIEAARLLASLPQRPRGMLNRSIQQLLELNKLIADLRDVAENPPDLDEYYNQFKKQAEMEQAHLLRSLKAQRWPFTDKLLQKTKESASKLSAIASKHLEEAEKVTVARVALTLLGEAGLYKPGGKFSPYHLRLKQLEEAIKQAEIQAILQHQRANNRLKVSLGHRQAGISQSSTWLSLTSRRDLLDWVQLAELFDQFSNNLEAEPTSLILLMRCLLLLIGGEKPAIIVQQLLGELKEKQQQLFKTDEFEKMRLHVLSTVLVAVLILFDIVNPDTANIEPLLDSYFDLRDRSLDEPSLLENNISILQHIIRETKAAYKTMPDMKKNQSFPSSFALRHNQSVETMLAAWVNNQCAGNPSLVQILDRSSIYIRLKENKLNSEESFDNLRERNQLLGYRDEMAGHDRFFLLLGLGEASNTFLTDLNLQHSSQIRAVQFPDPEKLIYLHIHRIGQVFHSSITPP